jgi:hypothetical protein
MPPEKRPLSSSAALTSTVPDIPLYLIPRVVADQIREKRELVFQITITRARCHYYTIAIVTSDAHRNQPAVPARQTQAAREES